MALPAVVAEVANQLVHSRRRPTIVVYEQLPHAASDTRVSLVWHDIGQFIMAEPGMTTEGIYGLGHSTRRFAEDFFAVHFGVANHVLREDAVEFLAFALSIKLPHLDIHFGHLYHVFTQGGLVEERRRLAGVGAVDEVAILVTALQQESGCTFAKKRTGLPVEDVHDVGEQPFRGDHEHEPGGTGGQYFSRRLKPFCLPGALAFQRVGTIRS